MKQKPTRATLKEVAKRAGVSTSAVSRAFTKSASISPKTRAKVESAANELKYYPNFLARSLTTNSTKLIALISDNYSNPLFLEVFDLFTRKLHEEGLRPLLYNHDVEKASESTARMIKRYNVDGIIIASSTIAKKLIAELAKIDCPIVHTFGQYSNNSVVNVVGPDNWHGGQLAAQLIIKKKKEKVLFLGGPKKATSTRDRFAGFKATLAQQNIPIADAIYCKYYSYEAGKQSMRQYLEKNGLQHIDVVFCGDDLICMGAIDAAIEHNYRIPADVGFIGFNNIPIASWGKFKLTTIHQPVRDITLNSVEMVLSMLKNPNPNPRAVIFPCKAIERETF